MRETRSTRVERHPSGCIIVRCIEGIVQTVEDAQQNVAVSVDLAGGKRRAPLLVDITKVSQLSSEVRHYYAGGALADNFTALGLIVEDSALGRMMGDIFFRMVDRVYSRDNEGGIRSRVFTDEERAVAWLASQER